MVTNILRDSLKASVILAQLRKEKVRFEDVSNKLAQ